jgi:phage tail sheath protein FI
VPDPLQESRLADFPPCGVVAGVIARTDAQRGIWKAPAGIDAGLRGVPDLTQAVTDAEQGSLNQLGVNVLRGFPVYGRVLWGARTLNGADVQASQWKYVPVRRLALYLEESLLRGSRWAVFEPNGPQLWSQLRLSIGAFMHQLFRQGAFAGTSAQDAYLVKCDAETTQPGDIDRGIVNVLVGFAPLKPAEFVIIRLQQLAAQAGQ